LHICDAALSQGKSVAYYALEDEDTSYATSLMCIHFGIPESAFEACRIGKQTSYGSKIAEAIDWFANLGDKWRVYDLSWDVDNWRRFPSLVAADKRRNDTDLIFVDHLQQWSGEYDELKQISTMLMKTAQKNDLGIFLISQVSNDTIKYGSAAGQIATKGAGDFGAVAHLGMEIFKDFNKSDFVATAPVLDLLEQQGTRQYLNKAQEVCEIRFSVKAVRRGSTPTFYVIFDVFSGRCLAEYKDPFVLV
jgi:hypothetical protein